MNILFQLAHPAHVHFFKGIINELENNGNVCHIIVRNKDIRLILLICTGVMVYLGIILGYALIPSSPFIYLGWGLIILHFISLFSHLNID